MDEIIQGAADRYLVKKQRSARNVPRAKIEAFLGYLGDSCNVTRSARRAGLAYDAGPGIRSEADVRTLTDFFRARRGAARAFRFRDPFDCSSAADGGLPAAADQVLGVGDGSRRQFALVKRYGAGDAEQVRAIALPVEGSVRVSVDGLETAAFSVSEGGVLLDAAPGAGAVVRAGYLFDVPVRFAEDRLEASRATYLAGELASVPLVEVRAPW